MLLVLGTLAGACNGGGDKTADPTVPTRPPTSGATDSTATPVAGADVAAIPVVLDELYLNRVLAALDSVEREAVRHIADAKNLNAPAVELLGSIYSAPALANETDAWLTELERDPALRSTPADTPGRTTVVDHVISSSPTCVYIAVARSYMQTGVARIEYVGLQPLDQRNDPKNHNPTAWMIVKNGLLSDGGQPEDPCIRE